MQCLPLHDNLAFSSEDKTTGAREILRYASDGVFVDVIQPLVYWEIIYELTT